MNNYQQLHQTVLTDPAITAETDELDPSFYAQGPLDDPEDDETEDDDEFPTGGDLEDDDYDQNQDTEEDLGLNDDDEEDDF